MTTPRIDINMDKPCKKCGEMGATPSGYCLSCAADLILDMFAGLFTVPSLAIKHGRRGIGIELNHEYWKSGVRYCQDAEREKLAPTLFDYLALQQAQAGADQR